MKIKRDFFGTVIYRKASLDKKKKMFFFFWGGGGGGGEYIMKERRYNLDSFRYVH